MPPIFYGIWALGFVLLMWRSARRFERTLRNSEQKTAAERGFYWSVSSAIGNGLMSGAIAYGIQLGMTRFFG